MNKTAIKNFAVEARLMLISSCTQIAFEYDVTEGGKNDPSAGLVNGHTLTDIEKAQRAQLIRNISDRGFAQVMEEAAYTWFNRFIALRFMEVNNYLPSHMRIFSDESGAFKPEVMTEAVQLDIDGLDKETVLELVEKQENEKLYKYIIITQCNALNSGLPEMFEQIGGWTELLFPRNLLREDSVAAKMVNEIPEEDWKDQVQIIGWLYQYYNTEPKNKVFEGLKKNQKITAENIPAATQLFTPDWIVRYMVENSLGRLWIEGHGKIDSADWKYYLDEAKQEEAVEAQLAKMRAEYSSIRPEQIKFIDPCMGSGHILVYAFDVLMEIYTSCGWLERDAAQSILRHNLFGLDIDRRAYQLAYFSVMMKARQYNRRIFSPENQPNLANFADASGADVSMLSGAIRSFAQQFEHADTYGSLMTVTAPDGIDKAVSEYSYTLGLSYRQLDMMMKIYNILSQKYDVVCTNPPYMGSSGMNGVLSDFVKDKFPDGKSDLFACFIERCGHFAKQHGYYAMVTQHAWMFLSSYEKLREKLTAKNFINMAHLGARAFDEIGGEVVQTTAFVHENTHKKDYNGLYARLVDIVGESEKRDLFLSGEKRYIAKQENFSKIPGSPVAYWVSENVQSAFSNGTILKFIAEPKQGMVTRDNNRFMRSWWETGFDRMALNVFSHEESSRSNKKWYPCTSGGAYRKWYGNLESVVNFKNDGKEIIEFSGSHIKNREYYFRESITWSAISSSKLSMRYVPKGFLPEHAGNCLYCNSEYLSLLQAFANSIVGLHFLGILSPTLNYNVGDVASLPIIIPIDKQLCTIVDITNNLREESKNDWDSFETSWDFKRHPLI